MSDLKNTLINTTFFICFAVGTLFINTPPTFAQTCPSGSTCYAADSGVCTSFTADCVYSATNGCCSPGYPLCCPIPPTTCPIGATCYAADSGVCSSSTAICVYSATNDCCIPSAPLCCPIDAFPTSGGKAVDFPTLYGAIQNKPGLIGSLGNATVGGIVSALVNVIFPVAGLLLLLYLIYGGFSYMTSAGDPKKAQMAQSIITNALTGFIIVFFAYWVVQLAAYILGLRDSGFGNTFSI